MGFWKSVGKAIFDGLPAVMLYKSLTAQPAQPAEPVDAEPFASEVPVVPVVSGEKVNRRRQQYSPNAPVERRTLPSRNDQQMLGDNKTLLGG